MYFTPFQAWNQYDKRKNFKQEKTETFKDSVDIKTKRKYFIEQEPVSNIGNEICDRFVGIIRCRQAGTWQTKLQYTKYRWYQTSLWKRTVTIVNYKVDYDWLVQWKDQQIEPPTITVR